MCAKPRSFRFGRVTSWTGKRRSIELRSAATSRVSRISISVSAACTGAALVRLTDVSP